MSQSIVTYFIQRGTDGPIKIGKTKSVSKRLKELQIGCAESLSLRGWIHGDVESQIHELFSDHRMNGEWFRPDESILSFIELRASVDARDTVAAVAKTILNLSRQAATELQEFWFYAAVNGKNYPAMKRMCDELDFLQSAVTRMTSQSNLLSEAAQ
jgi:hypothetical protein